MDQKGNKRERTPLGLTCKSTKCEAGLHCFIPSRRKKKPQTESLFGDGACTSCGAQLIDWKRVHKRDLNDANHTIECLNTELIRHSFWHKEIDIGAENHAMRKGFVALRVATEHRLSKYFRNPVIPGQPTFDGRNTRYDGNAIFYAQHATSTCCRKCIQTWHGIQQDVELSEEQITYFTDLIMLYIRQKLPYLTNEGQIVPRLKNGTDVVLEGGIDECKKFD